MKTKFSILALFAFLVTTITVAQESYADVVSVGDVMIIGSPSGNSYEHVEIPRKNFIIKKGGIANISSIAQNKVEVTDLKTKNGTTLVSLKKMDGKKFFNAYRILKADLNAAINSGELKILKGGKSEMSK
jgi:hypothetical protein